MKTRAPKSGGYTSPDRAVELRLQASADAISEKTIENALSGDMVAAKLALDNGVRKTGDRKISFPLRAIRNLKDAELAMFDVLNGAAQGQMTPAEALTVVKHLVG